MNSPWAILLCKFTGEDDEPYPRQRFEELFTSAGVGQWNMIDYFDAITHGQLDLNGSRVFPSPEIGWYRLAQRRSDYMGTATKPDGRGSLMTWARQAAAANGDELGGFANIVVVNGVSTDLFGGLGGVATDDGRDAGNGMTSLSPSVLGQEMSHGYGVEHARIDGSTADYMDPYDVMSAKSAFMAPHPVYSELDARGRPVFLIGPGLNAAAMASKGWLDAARVWTAGNALGSTVVLRPLHRRDLPGYLCARIDDFFVEFRMNDRWDAAFTSPVVLIHDFFDGHSYLRPTATGLQGLRTGDSFDDGDVSANSAVVHGRGLRISVTNIDAADQAATVEVRRWVDNRPEPQTHGQIFGGVDVDGGGWFISKGRVIKVPPRSPVNELLDHLAQVQLSDTIEHDLARGLIREAAFNAISTIAAEHAQRPLSLHSPAQALDPREGEIPA